ncbi:maleylpyruvate isomerase family mycothiol-dependent enzyme [Aeromicrobium sp. NPDC092404]|uniref:maleylpyruvate isomerase family mycothiol-dependent enzyme n=1 Tax=Aeromicrobium sp. NPDC092404 TaxID=3154976 RepID=UPI0034481EB8
MDHMLELGSAMSRFAEIVGKASGDETVPACPGWTVRDLATHLGTIHRWAAATVLCGQRLHEPEVLVTEPVVEWYAGTATALLSALQAVSPEEPVPNFSYVGETAAFWARRQMHETTVHTTDAAQAVGIDEADWGVAAAVAADGIDEVVQVFFPRMTARRQRPDVRSRIRLIATDVQQSWLIAPGTGDFGPPIELHPSLDADGSVSGTAVELYLGLWKRLGPERLDFEGVDGRILFDGPTTP